MSPHQTFLDVQATKALELALTDDQDEKTQEAFRWYNHIKNGRRAFGNITFAGITQHVAKYALVQHDTKMQHIYHELMLNHWQIPMPNLLISVTGSAHMIKGINGALLDAFRRGMSIKCSLPSILFSLK